MGLSTCPSQYRSLATQRMARHPAARKLVSILDKEGAPVAMSPSGPAPHGNELVRPGGGFRIEGAHAGPSEASPTSTALSRTASDPAFLKWKQQDEQSVHTLRMMKKERRNPFGSWYEGSKVVEKIGGVNATEERQLFYWFVEAANGNKPGVTPNVIWMNGGPGASSITGLLVENIGPLTMDQSDGLLKENPHAWSNDYNVMVIDNPVGSGFSYTGKKSYVTSEKEMREDFYTALKSYGGKYVPNVAYEIQLRGELPLKGVIIGNGVYSGKIQAPTVPDFAYASGVIDERGYEAAKTKFQHCVQLIEEGSLKEAEEFCEDSVRWLYASNKSAGGVFYYDLGLPDASFLDRITDQLSKYLNSAPTREALHTGPVADALLADFETEQGMRVIEALLEKGYQVVSYNGVRDGSVCNHLGNLLSLKALQWPGRSAFADAATEPWRPLGQLAGYKRSAHPLSYYTVLYTGHLVPMIVPDVARALIGEIVGVATPSSVIV
eukprot:g16437.t1